MSEKPHPSEEPVYDLKEVSKILKMNPASVRRLIERGWLKKVKNFRHVRITQRSLDNFLVSMAKKRRQSLSRYAKEQKRLNALNQEQQTKIEFLQTMAREPLAKWFYGALIWEVNGEIEGTLQTYKVLFSPVHEEVVLAIVEEGKNQPVQANITSNPELVKSAFTLAHCELDVHIPKHTALDAARLEFLKNFISHPNARVSNPEWFGPWAWSVKYHRHADFFWSAGLTPEGHPVIGFSMGSESAKNLTYVVKNDPEMLHGVMGYQESQSIDAGI